MNVREKREKGILTRANAQAFHSVKVVLHRSHGYFFGVKIKTVKLVGGRRFLAARSGLNDLKAALYACPNHTDDGIHSDHGYLETWEIHGGPP